MFNNDHIMNQLTGMSPFTAQHYYHVVAQMNAYAHTHGGQNPQSGYDQRSFGSQSSYNGADPMGVAGRAFMRSLFAH